MKVLYIIFSFLSVSFCCLYFLIDVVGILAGVGRERVYERNRVATKYKVIELESNG